MVSKKFYCSFTYLSWRVIAALLPVIAIVADIAYCLAKGRGPLHPITLQVVVAALIASVPLLMIAIGIYIVLFPVTLTEQAIIGHNERGKKQYIEWPDLCYGGTLTSGGFPCHKLQSRSSARHVVVPAFLSRFELFKNELAARGISFTVEERPRPAPLFARRARIEIEPLREGKYIVVTTERARQKN